MIRNEVREQFMWKDTLPTDIITIFTGDETTVWTFMFIRVDPAVPCSKKIKQKILNISRQIIK